MKGIRARGSESVMTIGTLLLALATVTPAVAAAAPGAVWCSAAFLAGSTKPDAGLADYQWDTRPRAAWGGEALVGRGRYATGLRVQQTRTTQEIGAMSSSPTARVALLGLDWVGRVRLATWWGQRIQAHVHVGQLHLGYQPDQVTIDPGTGTPLVVALKPVREWNWGGGLGVERTLGRAWSAGLAVEHRAFGLETAHRNGGVVEIERRSFGDWGARVSLAWHRGRW